MTVVKNKNNNKQPSKSAQKSNSRKNASINNQADNKNKDKDSAYKRYAKYVKIHKKIKSGEKNKKTLIKSLTKELSKASEELDKYYTKQSVADYCYKIMKDYMINSCKMDMSKVLFVEPSAGSGVFLNPITEKKIGFDLAPSNKKVIKNDFLVGDIRNHMGKSMASKTMAFIGNPPFGRKSKLAIDFVNKSFEYSDLVGFIVPIQFRKWSVQSKIHKDARLVIDADLQENAFEFMGKDYKLRCCFQVWDKSKTNNNVNAVKDLRISGKPPTSHKDFEMYQYNRTDEALKFFDKDWDFAVTRQGFNDYGKKYFKKEDCDKKQQWIFFKAKNKKTLNRLMKIDFEKLSKKNIGTPGFGKADVIQEYNEVFPDIKK